MILEEVNESSQQNTLKIRFLESQKQQLLEEINNLRDTLFLNKQALQQMIIIIQQKYPNQQSIANLQTAVNQLNRQNQMLKTINNNLQQSVSSLKCQILINSQIKQQIEQQYQSTIKNYEQKILQLRRTIQDKQFVIQEKETTKKDPFKLKDAGIFPRHDLVKMQVTVQDSLALTKKLSIDNNQLNTTLAAMRKQLSSKSGYLNRLQMIIKNTVSYLSLKDCIQRAEMKRSLSSQTINRPISKSSIKRVSQQNLQNKIIQQKSPKSSQQICNQIPEKIVSNLRQLFFREKKNSQLLARELCNLTTKHKGLINTNKLLTESNINYQIKRDQIKAQVEFYKLKYNQCLIILKQRKQYTRQLSTGKSSSFNVNQRKQNILNNNISEIKKPNISKVQLKKIMNQSSIQWSNSIIRHIKQSKFKRSTSCLLDYIFKPTITIKKSETEKVSKIKNIQQSIIDPFLLDYSVIKPADDFGDISACFKKSKQKRDIISSKKTKEKIMIF